MKTRFLLPICLFAVLAFPAWGAVLLSEGFDGMEKGKLPKGWECSKTIDYYTNNYSAVPPSLKFEKEGLTISSRPFAKGATNVSFMAYTAQENGECNKYQVNGWDGEEWIPIGTVQEPDIEAKKHQKFSFPIDNDQITRVQIIFAKKVYNAALDDIVVEGPFSIICDREDGFQLPQGTGDAITAWAEYDFATADTEFAYTWSGALEGTDAVLEIPDDLAPGIYEVTCTATVVGDEETSVSGAISFRVLEFHDITVEECEHGTITAGVETAVEGTVVLLEATPESDAYVLSSIAINGEKLSPGTLEFTMPDSNVVVTAVFKLDEEGDLIITFDDNSNKNPAYASPSFFAKCISEGIVVSNRFASLLCQGGAPGASGTDLAMRVKHEGKGANITNGFFANADELEHPIARISFDYKAASASHLKRDWALQTSTDGAHWTNMAKVTTTSADWGETCNVTEGIPQNSFWFRIISANSGTTARMADFDNINIWWGTASFRVKLTGVSPGERVVCDDDNPLVLTAIGLDGTEPYDYAWTWTVDGGDGGTEEGDTCTFSETGAYEVEVTCTDDDGEVSTANIHFTIEKQYRVICPTFTNGCAIVASTDKAFAGDTVTVVADPKRKYTLVGDITATCGGEPVEIIDGAFIMPAGDVEISGTFRQVEDVATLPFEWHGPWQSTMNLTVDGVSSATLGTDYDDKNYDGFGNGAAKLDKQDSMIQIRFDSAPDTISFMIRGNSLADCKCTVFLVQESEDGMNWDPVAVYETTNGVPPNDAKMDETLGLSPNSRYVKFGYKDALSKSSGAVGLDAIVITKAETPEPVSVKTAITEGGISFADGNAKLNVTLDPAAAIQGSDIWAAADLVGADWHTATNATVEESDGKYLITLPESEGNFISVGKPAFLEQ